MFRSKRVEPKFPELREHRITKSTYHRQLEALGARLDAVRQTLGGFDKDQQDSWAYHHWKTVESILLKKWELTLYKLESGLDELQASRYQPYVISYDWWEPEDGLAKLIAPFGFTWLNNFLDKVKLQKKLDASWEKARNDLLERTRRGLA